MKEFIYSRNAVYETLRARRRDVFKIELAEGVQVKSRLTEILALAAQRKIHELITKVYESLPFPVVHVPVLPPGERADYILGNLQRGK